MLIEKTANGIEYTWELAGSQGASFILYPSPNHTAEDIKKAKALLRSSQDVVSLSIADDDALDYRYKSDIFAIPATKPLKWYQIEQDEKILRTERKKGTTALEFVERFVLPFTKETEAKYFAKHGQKMYEF